MQCRCKASWKKTEEAVLTRSQGEPTRVSANTHTHREREKTYDCFPSEMGRHCVRILKRKILESEILGNAAGSKRAGRKDGPTYRVECHTHD